MPWTYLLECSDGSFYAGTWALDQRFARHQEGLGAEYTKRRRPVTLVFATEFERIDEASAFEKQIQGWSRAKRRALIEGDWAALPSLSTRGFRPGAPPSDAEAPPEDPAG